MPNGCAHRLKWNGNKLTRLTETERGAGGFGHTESKTEGTDDSFKSDTSHIISLLCFLCYLHLSK